MAGRDYVKERIEIEKEIRYQGYVLDIICEKCRFVTKDNPGDGHYCTKHNICVRQFATCKYFESKKGE